MQHLALLLPALIAITTLAHPRSANQVPHDNKSELNDGDDKGRGLVYNSADLTDLFPSSAISWAYNWKSEPLGHLSSQIQFVPMLWGTKQSTIKLWNQNADKAITSRHSSHFLGFNEPDLDSQANLSPREAADAWLKYLEPYAWKVKLGSPAVTNSQKAGKGLNWLSEFLEACHDCTIDFIAIHWYGHAGEVAGKSDDDNNNEGGDLIMIQKFKDHIAKAREIAKARPVWITEFQPQGDQTHQANFLNEILPWLDDKGKSGVERYAYWKVDGFLASGNKLTESGAVYDAA